MFRSLFVIFVAFVVMFESIAQATPRHLDRKQTIEYNFKNFNELFSFTEIMDAPYDLNSFLRDLAKKEKISADSRVPKFSVNQDQIYVEGLPAPIMVDLADRKLIYKGSSFQYDLKKSSEDNYLQLKSAWKRFPEFGFKISSRSSLFINEAQAFIFLLFGGVSLVAGALALGGGVMGYIHYWDFINSFDQDAVWDNAVKEPIILKCPAKTATYNKQPAILTNGKIRLEVHLSEPGESASYGCFGLTNGIKKILQTDIDGCLQNNGHGIDLVKDPRARSESKDPTYLEPKDKEALIKTLVEMRTACKTEKQDEFNKKISKFQDSVKRGIVMYKMETVNRLVPAGVGGNGQAQ